MPPHSGQISGLVSLPLSDTLTLYERAIHQQSEQRAIGSTPATSRILLFFLISLKNATYGLPIVIFQGILSIGSLRVASIKKDTRILHHLRRRSHDPF
jgi:hypothetical protein